MIKKFALSAKPRKLLSIIAALLVLYTLAGFFVLPAVLRHQLPAMLRDATGRDSSIAAVAFHPWQLSLQLQGFELKEKSGRPFIKFAEFYADFNVWRSLRLGLISLEEVRLKEPFANLGRQKSGAFNYDDLFPAVPEPQEPGLVPFEIAKLRLIGGSLDWRDEFYPLPAGESLHSVNLEITDLITRQDSEAALNISLLLKSGAKLDWNGTLMLSPLHSAGRIHIRELQTRRLWELFLQGNKSVTLNKGANEIDAQYRFDSNGEQLNINLSPLQIAVNGFSMAEKGKKHPLIDLQAFKLLDAQLEAKWTPSGDQWQVKIPQGRLELKKFALSDPGAQKLRVSLDGLALQGLGVELLLRDTLQFNAAHQKIDVKNAAITLNNQQPSKITAAAMTAGPTRFSARQTKPGSALEFNAAQDGLTLQKLALTLPATRETLLEVAAVVIGKVQFAMQPQANAAPQIKVSQNKFEAKQITLHETGQTEPLASAASASVGGVQFDLDKKQVKIASVASSGADIKAWLNSDGTLNYQALFAAKSAVQPQPRKNEAQPAPATEPAAQSSKPPSAVTEPLAPAEKWSIAVDKLALDNGAVSFQDRSRKPQAAFRLAAINLAAENVDTASNAKFPLRFSALFNDSGKIELKGNAAVQPFSAAFDINVAQFPLKPFQPYFNQFVRLDVLSGALHVGGALALDMSDARQPQVSFKGAAGITQFHSRDQLAHKDFAKWERFALQDFAFDLQPLRFSAAEVRFDQAYLRVAIDKERAVNLAAIMVEQPPHPIAPQAQQPSAAAEKTAPIAVKIKQIKLYEGRSDFSDFSLMIPFTAHIGHLDGILGGLSSERDAEASLQLQGSVLDLAPVDIDGQFQPYRGISKVSLKFRSLPLPAATPYMAEFAGYKIEKGQLSLDLNYEIVKGRLKASNKMLIDQLALGEKVKSPHAVSLSLELAVALLKDAQGKINIDFPITGSLEDPKFSLRALIADALTNVVSKVVTSPFRAIAALLGRKNADLGHIAFPPGSAVLTETESGKLDGLAKVFAERTVLKLDIKGTAYQQEDWPELTDDALLEQLEELRSQELRKKGEILAAEDVELSADEYRRLLADLFIAKFPHLAKRSLFGTPKLIDGDKSDFYALAKQKLRAQIPPDPAMLNALAAERGQAIARYLIRQKGLDNSRMFILDAKVQPQAPKNGMTTELFLRGP
jgi:hypothetical protein